LSVVRFPAVSRKTKIEGHVALWIVQIAYGLFPLFGTIAFSSRGLSPLGVGSWRIGAGAIGLTAAAVLFHSKQLSIHREDWLRIAACAVLGVVVNQGLFVTGLARSTPANAGLVMTLIPIFTFSIAALSGQENFRFIRGVGVSIALVGAMPLIFPQGFGTLGGYGLGNLMMAVNALSFSAYLVVSKPLVHRYPPMVVAAWTYVVSLIALPWFAWNEKMLPDPGFAMGWWSLVYIIVFPTILCYWLNNFALARVRASTTAVYVYLQPLISVGASWVVFGERIGPMMFAAGAALFVGIWLVAFAPTEIKSPFTRRAKTADAG
jgi:drug/metabolite transporter (DMT)-like permease